MGPPLHAWITETAPRVYLLTLPAETSDDELARFIAARESWARRCDHPHAWVVDARQLTAVTTRQRQRFAKHLDAYEACDARWNAGSGIVLENKIARGVVTAVFWLKSPRFPHRTFATPTDARRWCRARLAEFQSRNGNTARRFDG